MCGIAGYFGEKNFVVNKNQQKKIFKIMSYRGPDNKGVFEKKLSNRFLKIFHARLSIIDPLERSNQPFEDDQGVISFNGMIYNYLEIKKDLISKGINFKTTSDTEVLLKFLNYYGVSKINKLDGMWAFVYYNYKKKKLFICRDRFGEKPLYFFKNKKDIIFGSSIDFILTISRTKHKIDKRQAETYLKNGFRSLFFQKNAQSLFKDIFSFEPGKYYIFDENFIMKERSYWNSKINKIRQNNYYSATKKLKNIFKYNISQRVRSDYPIACLLSGGIDSSTIACNIPKKDRSHTHFFSAYSKDKNYDESKYIDELVKKKKLNHSYVKVKKDNKKNLKIIENIINRTGNLVPTVSWLLYCYLCEKIKKKKIRVILTGTGGDELFAGYYAHHLHFLQSLKLRKSKEFLINYHDWLRYIYPMLRNKNLKNFQFYSKNYLKIDAYKMEYLSVNKYFKKYNFKKEMDEFYLKDYFKNELYKEIFFSSLPPQIFATDSISMFYNLESRLPFLSKDLYRFSFSLPNTYLIRDGFNKSILRDSLKKIVPNNILRNREKVGFFKSIDEFFDFSDRKLQNKILSNKYLNSLLKVNKFKKMLIKKDKSNQECHLIFSLINLVIFFKKYKNFI